MAMMALYSALLTLKVGKVDTETKMVDGKLWLGDPPLS